MENDTRLATRLLHADHDHAKGPEVSANISVSTTFKHPNPDEKNLWPAYNPHSPAYDIYSRYSQPTLTRAEKVLSSLLGGNALVYSSGLASAAAAIFHIKPRTIAITEGYHGVHVIISQYKTLRDGDVNVIGLDDAYPAGTLAWVETPLNPTGEARNLQHYAQKVHAVGGKLVVDATLAPPPLQDPFKFGADIVMHSGTKYFGGHSDALTGVLAVQSRDEWIQLWTQRMAQGNVPGSLESWLLLRSLRTLKLRVLQQSKTATTLAEWLDKICKHAPNPDQTYDGFPGGVIDKVWHASLQKPVGDFIAVGKNGKSQMSGGPATFAIQTKTVHQASWLPHRCKLFVSATSLGGVESLMEQRAMSDPHADPKIVRLSIGVEDIEDLKEDLRQAACQILKGGTPSRL